MNLVEPQRSGYVYNIVESKPFRAVTCLVIVINSISIALMTDWSIAHGPAGMPWAYIAVDLACLVPLADLRGLFSGFRWPTASSSYSASGFIAFTSS